jgi:hypothetical protein
MARIRKKAELPTKICAGCGRPFSWRRKWARDWPQVRYCSRRCAAQGAGANELATTHRNRVAPPFDRTAEPWRNIGEP